MELTKKYQELTEYLSSFQGVLVAFSAGVDSTLVLKAAIDSGVRVLAVTAVSELRPSVESELANVLARELGAPWQRVQTRELDNAEFSINPRNRCYLCKRHLCQRLWEIAAEHNLEQVVDGSNADDLDLFRPGKQALKEYKVISPLAQVGLTKIEIRNLARDLALPNWDRPSNPCLATRFPYGTRLNSADLKRVEAGEKYLRDHGFNRLRLRSHKEIVRVEIPPSEFPSLVSKSQEIIRGLKALGFKHITLDLEGLRSGSFDR